MYTFMHTSYRKNWCAYFSTKIQVQPELELELIPFQNPELELELIPFKQPGIGIGINSFIFGITNSLILIYIGRHKKSVTHGVLNILMQHGLSVQTLPLDEQNVQNKMIKVNK